jgi:SLBB domain-containing protein
MRQSSTNRSVSSNVRRRLFAWCLKVSVIAASAMLAANPSRAQSQYATGILTSRVDLTTAAEQADQAKNALLAASIRQRLRDGDFQVGDRVFVGMVSDVMHRDTLIVRTGRILELPGKITVPLAGVLRSELKDRVTTEVMKYVRAREIEVTPLTRLGVLGEVAHPGYFAFASDTPLSDAIMGAGGPTPIANVEQSVIRRGTVVFRSADETRRAIASGLTLDQFGINAGDELVIGRQRDFSSATVLGFVGAAASLLTVFVALHR